MRKLAMLALIVIAGRSQGQAAAQAGAGDLRQIAQTISEQLFAGISLTPKQKTASDSVILRTLHEQVGLQGESGWAKLLELQAKRDSTLRALITADEDRRKFDAHADAMRPRGPHNP